ncbi:hypothetical protein PHISP_07280 [Aspergillus sp. HF37]|nr:hypothetical protein PHISP_07280 [Aspergillus sp. HF37]
MHFASLLKAGAVLAMAQSVSAAHIHVKNTTPPANPSEIRCTMIIDDPINGCQGSSAPWEENCGRNEGDSSTRAFPSCNNGGEVTVNWYTGLVNYQDNEGTKAHCVLSKTKTGGECDTDHPNRYEKGDYDAANGLGGNALYALAPMVAAGVFL